MTYFSDVPECSWVCGWCVVVKRHCVDGRCYACELVDLSWGGGVNNWENGLIVQIEISCGAFYTSRHAENLEDFYLPV